MPHSSFPQAPGAKTLFISLRRRALAPLAWLTRLAARRRGRAGRAAARPGPARLRCPVGRRRVRSADRAPPRAWTLATWLPRLAARRRGRAGRAAARPGPTRVTSAPPASPPLRPPWGRNGRTGRCRLRSPSALGGGGQGEVGLAVRPMSVAPARAGCATPGCRACFPLRRRAKWLARSIARRARGRATLTRLAARRRGRAGRAAARPGPARLRCPVGRRARWRVNRAPLQAFAPSWLRFAKNRLRRRGPPLASAAGPDVGRRRLRRAASDRGRLRRCRQPPPPGAGPGNPPASG